VLLLRPPEALHVALRERPRPDHAHVAEEHVQELGGLVEPRGAEPFADARHLAAAHRAEFEDGERPPPPPDALLLEEHRAAVVELDERRGDQEERREHLAAEEGEADIVGAPSAVRLQRGGRGGRGRRRGISDRHTQPP
jgi:hypothetical protein